MRPLVVILIPIFLAACSSEPVQVGSKDTVESRVLAEMFALLLEEEGVPVKRRMQIGPTEVVFEALKDGSIDLYPESTGTVLSLMGETPLSGADDGTTYDLASRALAQSGLTLLEPLGIRPGYAVVMRPGSARRNRLERLSDLANRNDQLRLGVMQSFVEGSRDGMLPFLDRFGLSFAEIEVFPYGEKDDLYDALINGQVDVIVGSTTDPEIVDYELDLLADPSGFFANYDVAPLSSDEVLEKRPEISEILSVLSGKIDDTMIRRLNASIRFDGRPPSRVARQALFDLDLVDTPPNERTPVFGIATDPGRVGTEAGIATLRAVRQAMRGRDVDYLPVDLPFDAVANQEARLALTPAVSDFRLEDGTMVRDDRFEAIAAVGSVVLHALSRTDAPVQPVNASSIGSGPAGSASYQLAQAIAASNSQETIIVPLADNSVDAAAEAVRNSVVDVALVLAVVGRDDLRTLFESPGNITLVDSDAWWRSAARLSLPIMREAQINPGTYAGIDRTISTLATQLVLFGPAVSQDQFVFGERGQGPSSFFDEVRPLQPQNIKAINENLGIHGGIDPYLRRSPALRPKAEFPDERINPYPGRAVLMIVIFAFLGWAIYLFLRPDHPDSRTPRP